MGKAGAQSHFREGEGHVPGTPLASPSTFLSYHLELSEVFWVLVSVKMHEK